MNISKRRFVWIATAMLSAGTMSAQAQFGRQRGGESGGMRRRQDEPNARGPAQLGDPMAAIERELPSLRIDLKLSGEQPALFDSFERQVRSAAEAGRVRARHVSALHVGDDASLTADTVFAMLADDEHDRAEAARLSVERMKAFYAALTPEQQKQFDKRIVQALRDPLGS